MALPFFPARPWHRRVRVSPIIGAAGLLLLCPVLPAAPEEAEDTPDANRARPEALLSRLGPDWSTHGQLTAIAQGTPGFRNPYVGDNSLTPNQTRDTLTLTLFVARRLWEGATLVVNPEYAQGQGLNTTHGAAGFPNGEATKAGSIRGKLDLERAYLSQAFGLGGGPEESEASKNQLGGRRDVRRLTLTLGKFAAADFFDDNAYSHDPRTQFLNWSIWESAGWDYPADAKGYTYGFVAELNFKDWAVRYGAMALPRVANGLSMETDPTRALGQVVEYERRHELDGHPGKLRLLAFANHADMGKYRDAVAAVQADPASFPADITLSRARRWKYGAAVNLEQEIMRDLGAFLRLSANDGRTETWAFTEVDRSLALGAVLKGARWNRADDSVGLAAACNGLSADHRRYLALGGTGIILGDGRLRYAPEQIVEAFYDAKLPVPGRFANLAFNYQWLRHPGYNADRGPAHVLSTRLHLEF